MVLQTDFASWEVGHKGRFLTVSFNFWNRRWSRKISMWRPSKSHQFFQDPIREMSLRVQYLRVFDHKQPVFGPVYRSEFLSPLPKLYELLSRHVQLYVSDIPGTRVLLNKIFFKSFFIDWLLCRLKLLMDARNLQRIEMLIIWYNYYFLLGFSLLQFLVMNVNFDKCW